jgi:hypothetical protein
MPLIDHERKVTPISDISTELFDLLRENSTRIRNGIRLVELADGYYDHVLRETSRL